MEHKWREISARESATHRSEEGLEPVNEKTGKAELPTQRDSDLAQSEWILEFTVRLTEAGFSDVQVARILEAAERAAVELST